MKQDFSEIAEEFELSLIVLFGSAATGNTGPMSDVDVLVYAQKSLSLAKEGLLRSNLATALNTKEDSIDLVFAHEASGALLSQALTHGKLLYGDRQALIEKRLSAWHKLQDEKRWEQRRRDYLATRLAL